MGMMNQGCVHENTPTGSIPFLAGMLPVIWYTRRENTQATTYTITTMPTAA